MSQHEHPLDPLQARLSHQFEDLTLLEQALEHPSLRIDGEHPSAYERLEFLGDAVLELIISDHLFCSSDSPMSRKACSLACAQRCRTAPSCIPSPKSSIWAGISK
ncbi:MAG: ribonuclease III domain-containing protein [Verrucomicrobiota bacterium]